MLKTTLKLTALSAVSLTLLSACGAASKLEDAANKAQDEIDNATDRAQDELDRLAGGNGGNGNNQTPRDPFLADPVAAVADRISSEHVGGTYSTNGTPNTNHDDTDASVFSETQDTFSVRAGTTANTLIMTVNGVEHTLSKNAQNYYSSTGQIFLSDYFINHSARITNIEEVVAGTHATVQGMYVQYDTNAHDYESGAASFNFDSTKGYATIGTQTTAPVVASQTATATYTGTTEFSFGELTTNRSLTMTVDFDTDMVSGTINSISQSSEVVFITFAPAPIVGNGFAGTFTLNDAARNSHEITDNPTGNYAGNFFGPNADDLAGVMRIQGAHARGTVLGIGGFRADRDTQ